MMKSLFGYLILMLAMLFISSPSFALGKLGHQVVCQLAFDNLASKQQVKLQQLLTQIPKNHQDLINHYTYQKKGKAITFANACAWADAIKRVEEFTQYASWHYMNVPRNHSKIKANDCKENCLPQAILTHQQLLKVGADDWQQTQALLFLSHWLGDIHQPLHVSFASDLGGNQVKLSHLSTKCSNLHWYWDDCILYRGKQSKSKWLTLIATNWPNILVPNWQPNQVWQWADESFQLVKGADFHYCQMDAQETCQKPTQKVNLPDDYLTTHQQVMEQQLLLASKRLTKILQASL